MMGFKCNLDDASLTRLSSVNNNLMRFSRYFAACQMLIDVPSSDTRDVLLKIINIVHIYFHIELGLCVIR